MPVDAPAGSIPGPSLGRLSQYLRIVEELSLQGTLAVSSDELAQLAQVQPFLVRKDLAYCGRLGRRGQGYPVRLLLRSLGQALGQHQRWNYIIVGMAELGAALIHYPWPWQYSCVGLFDGPVSTQPALASQWNTAPRRFELPAIPTAFAQSPGYDAGGQLPPTLRELRVQPLGELGTFVRQNAVDLAMLCTPPTQAQQSAQAIRSAGIGAILNFTGLPLQPYQSDTTHLQEAGHEERDTVIENVDFVTGLHRLSVQILLAQQSTHPPEEL